MVQRLTPAQRLTRWSRYVATAGKYAKRVTDDDLTAMAYDSHLTANIRAIERADTAIDYLLLRLDPPDWDVALSEEP